MLNIFPLKVPYLLKISISPQNPDISSKSLYLLKTQRVRTKEEVGKKPPLF